MSMLLWTVLAFISGSLPFSVWLGRIALKTDIRRYGDQNPGAFNVMRAGGWAIGLLAACLDITKGVVPVALAWRLGDLSGWALVPVALAPVLGHAFSPFLNFRGGKAIAVTGGVWIGLLGPKGILIPLAFMIFWYILITVDGWSVVLAMALFLVYLIWTNQGGPALAVWLGNTLILAWKHRSDLGQMPHLRPWLRKAVGL